MSRQTILAINVVVVGWTAVVRYLTYIDGDVVDSSFAMLPHVPPLWIPPRLLNDTVHRVWSMCCHATMVDILSWGQSLRCRLVS